MFISDIVAEVEELSVWGSIPEGEGGGGEDTFHHLLIIMINEILDHSVYMLFDSS